MWGLPQVVCVWGGCLKLLGGWACEGRATGGMGLCVVVWVDSFYHHSVCPFESRSLLSPSCAAAMAARAG